MSRPRLPIDYKLEAPKVYLSLYRHARQTQQKAPATATTDQFTRGLLLALRIAGLTVEPVPLETGRWLINGVVWLEVIGARRDLAQARGDLRAAMHRQPRRWWAICSNSPSRYAGAGSRSPTAGWGRW